MALWQKPQSALGRLTKKALSTWPLQKKIYYYTPIEGLYGKFSNPFGRAGDSGAAVIDRFGLFVGLYFAGNDYTGVRYFVAADKLFAVIKHITKASSLQVL